MLEWFACNRPQHWLKISVWWCNLFKVLFSLHIAYMFVKSNRSEWLKSNRIVNFLNHWICHTSSYFVNDLLFGLVSGTPGVCLGHAAAPRQHHFVDCQLESFLFKLGSWANDHLSRFCLGFSGWLLKSEIRHWNDAASDCAGHRIQVDDRESFTVGVVQPHRTLSDNLSKVSFLQKTHVLNWFRT